MLTVFPMPGLMDRATEERLHNGASFNNDGHGWAVVQGNRIVTGKSMDSTLAIDAFIKAYRNATGPALFHSRYATHGSETIANVHPFPVKKIRDTYVAHNGILPKSAHPAKGDDRSDTRIFADEILPQRYARLDRERVRNAMSNWLGHNKIAILTTNKRYSRQLYIIGQELGNWQDGVWFSNYDHEGFRFKWGGKGVEAVIGKHAQLDVNNEPIDMFRDRENECAWCHEVGKINNAEVCEVCGTCQDCFEPFRECSCYAPAFEPVGTGKGSEDARPLWDLAP